MRVILTPLNRLNLELKTCHQRKPKTQDMDEFTGEFYQTFHVEIVVLLHKSFQNMEEDGILPNLFCEDSIMLMPKPKISKKGKLQDKIAYEHQIQNAQQNGNKFNPTK